MRNFYFLRTNDHPDRLYTGLLSPVNMGTATNPIVLPPGPPGEAARAIFVRRLANVWNWYGEPTEFSDLGDDPPPTPNEIWMCSTVRCEDGRAITPGMVVFIDGFCYRVTNETNENPPLPRLPITAELQCVSSCSDPVCPTATLYWPGRFCSGDPRTVWVCGVPPGCHIRGCIIIDGGFPPITFDQIPDDPPLIARFIDLGPSAQNCCECRTTDPNDPPGEGPCLTTPLLEFTPGPPCHSGAGQTTCCCELEQVDGQSVPRTRSRLVRVRTEQQYVRPGFPDLEGTIVINMVDSCGLQFVMTRTGFGLPSGGETESGPSEPPFGSAACGRRCPGFWPAYAPRVVGINGSQRLIGLPGITWGNDCLSYENPDGTTTTTVVFSSVYTCNLFRQSAAYRYDDPQNGLTIFTRFEFEQVIVGDNNCLANCDSIVNGGNPTDGPIDAPPFGGPGPEGTDAPPAGGAGGGSGTPCSGCGAGQMRTRL